MSILEKHKLSLFKRHRSHTVNAEGSVMNPHLLLKARVKKWLHKKWNKIIQLSHMGVEGAGYQTCINTFVHSAV